MTKVIFSFILMLFALPVFAQDINGVLEVVEDKKVLKVWGDHFQRGYAHGYLLAEECKTVFDDYLVEHVCYGQPMIYNGMRAFFEDNYTIEENYQAEIDGLLAGMTDSGISLYNDDLQRDIDATDMLVANGIVDLSQALTTLRPLHLGCSSLSSWGTNTELDEILMGNQIVTRMMDWDIHPALTENHLLLVNIPAELDEQKWLSLTFPGFLGCLSGINENGICATLNVGNITTSQTGEMFYPILFSVRNGMESADYNDDGENNCADVVTAIEERNRSAGTIVHVTQNNQFESYPVVIESNNPAGVAVRDTSGNSVNPIITGQNLVATNHYRSLYSPAWCYRYQGISDSLEANANISPERSWGILSGAAGLAWNLHTMQYIPSEGMLYWAGASGTVPGYLNEPTVFNVDELLGKLSGENVITLPEIISFDPYGTFGLDLTNEDAIVFGEISFTYDEYSYFEIEDVITTERTEDFNIQWEIENLEGFYEIHVTFLDTSDTFILPGQGDILEFVWSGNTGCLPDTSTMHFTRAFLFNENFSPLEVETIDGFFFVQGGAVNDIDFSSVPQKYSLGDNYPNPFNPSTIIAFQLPERARHAVTLRVYDVSGKLVKTLVDGPMKVGYHSVIWDGKNNHGENVTSGLYFYRLKAGTTTITKQCLLLK